MDHERFRELSSTFLLWGLPEPELTEWQSELERRGETGETELASLREAFASVALAAPAAAPRPELRKRLVAAVTEEAGPRAPAAASATLAGGDMGARAARGAGGEGFLPPGRRPWPWLTAAAVAALLATLLAVWNVRLRDALDTAERRLDGRERDMASMERRVDEMDGELQAMQQRLAEADSVAAELETYRRDLDALASPTSRAHTLVGTENQPGAAARVFLDVHTGRAVIFLFDLPALPPGRVYELWAFKGGKPVAAGTFTPPREGRARVELEDARVLEGAEGLAVTVEPAPGGPVPTGEMVLSSS